MNKLLFNEGGQPLHLDDLKLLQDNMYTLIERMFFGIYKARISSNSITLSGGSYIELPGATVWLSGGIVAEVSPRTLTLPRSFDLEADLWVGLKERKTEDREYEDGQTRPCMLSYTAEYVLESEKRSAEFSSLNLWYRFRRSLQEYDVIQPYYSSPRGRSEGLYEVYNRKKTRVFFSKEFFNRGTASPVYMLFSAPYDAPRSVTMDSDLVDRFTNTLSEDFSVGGITYAYLFYRGVIELRRYNPTSRYYEIVEGDVPTIYFLGEIGSRKVVWEDPSNPNRIRAIS